MTTSTPDVPPFTGYVETTLHALRLIQAARQGVIPRITRRLNDAERRTMIKSGAIFVFSVEESGIKRWTDGLLWSPSRIVGNFLVYREISERASSRTGPKKPYPLDSQARCSPSRRGSPDDLPVAFNKGPGHLSQADHNIHKAGGLIKRTITVKIDESDLHLICYYTSEDIRTGRLKKPTSRPDIMSLPLPPDIFRSTNFRVPPKTQSEPDGIDRFVGEADDLEAPAGCKLDQQVYDVQGSQWSPPSSAHHPPRVDNPYPTGTTYTQSHGSHMPPSSVYNREDTGSEKWPVSLSSLRIAPIVTNRQDHHDSWPSPPSPNQAQGPRRRDSGQGHVVGSYPNIHPHSPRWRSDSHSPSVGYGLQADRRSRAHAIYDHSHVGSYRRENDTASRFSTSSESNENGREAGSPRLAWSLREAPTEDKYLRSSQATPSFQMASTPLSFSQNHGYPRVNSSFATWSSNDGVEGADAPLHSIPSHHVALTSYEPAYSSSPF